MWASLSPCPAGISGPGSALPSRPGVTAAGTWQHCPIYRTRRRHLSRHHALMEPLFLWKTLFLLLPVPLHAKSGRGWYPAPIRCSELAKTPARLQKMKVWGGPEQWHQSLGTNRTGRSTQRCFSLELQFSAHPTSNNGGAEPGGNYSCSRAHLRGLTVLPWGLAVPRSHGEASWKWRKVGMAGTQVTPCFGHFPILSSPWKCPKNVDETLEDMGG